MQRVQNQPLWYRWKHGKSEATAVNAGEPTLGEPNNTHSYPNRRNGQDPLESPCWTDSNECSPDCYSSWVQLGGWVQVIRPLVETCWSGEWRKMIQSTQDHSLGKKFTLQQGNGSTHAFWSTMAIGWVLVCCVPSTGIWRAHVTLMTVWTLLYGGVYQLSSTLLLNQTYSCKFLQKKKKKAKDKLVQLSKGLCSNLQHLHICGTASSASAFEWWIQHSCQVLPQQRLRAVAEHMFAVAHCSEFESGFLA